MKRLLFILFLLPLLVACNQRNGNCNDYPEIADAAYGYLDAVANYRFDDAIQYASPATCEKAIPFFKSMLALIPHDSIAAKLPAVVTIYEVLSVEDSSARVYYRKTDKRVNHTDTLNMVLVDGRWCADVYVEIPPMVQVLLDTNLNKMIPRTDEERDSMFRARFPQKKH